MARNNPFPQAPIPMLGPRPPPPGNFSLSFGYREKLITNWLIRSCFWSSGLPGGREQTTPQACYVYASHALSSGRLLPPWPDLPVGRSLFPRCIPWVAVGSRAHPQARHAASGTALFASRGAALHPRPDAGQFRAGRYRLKILLKLRILQVAL